MKHMLLRLFAVIGILCSIALLIVGLTTYYVVEEMTQTPDAPDSMVLSLDFTVPVSEKISDEGFSIEQLLSEGDTPTPLIHILRALNNAKTDPKVKGVVAHFGSEPVSLVHAQEIAAALESFRQSGKFTYAYGVSYGDFASMGANYYLASQFENIWLQPVSSVGLSNISLETPFGKTALNNLGVQGDFMRRDEYKSVMENVTRDSYSPEVKANMKSLIQSFNDQLVAGLAKSRKVDTRQAAAFMSNGPYTANEALKAGLVTKLGYPDDFSDEIDAKAGKEAESVSPSTYLFLAANDHKKPEAKARIATIFAQGMITDEPVKGPARLAEEEVMDAQSIVDAFDDAASDDSIKAILFRVDSPGGSPVASETIRHALIKAKQSKKPVFVSMGRVAASGGYWIAANGDRLYADPATITGSIGVVSGKFVFGGLFDKLGIKWDTITADNAELMWSVRTPFSDKSRARINAQLDDTYKTFTSLVSEARKIAPEKMPDVAKGRVFTGEQALKVGLVDEVGGMNNAIDGLKKELKLAETDAVLLVPFPAPETSEEFAFRLLQNLKRGAVSVSALSNLTTQLHGVLGPVLGAFNQPKAQQTTLPTAFQIHGL